MAITTKFSGCMDQAPSPARAAERSWAMLHSRRIASEIITERVRDALHDTEIEMRRAARQRMDVEYSVWRQSERLRRI